MELFDEFTGVRDPDSPKARKRMHIITAATELFLRQGYRKTSVDDVARQAGLSKGTIYLYFKNKSDLMLQAIAEEKRQYLEEMLPLFTDEAPSLNKLRRWLKMALRMAEKMPLVSRLISGDNEMLLLLQEMDTPTRDRMTEIQLQFLGEMIGDAALPHRWAPEALMDRVKVLYGFVMASGAFADERLRGGLSYDRFTDILADWIVGGLTAKHGGEE